MPRCGTIVQDQIFTQLSKYEVGCYLRYCGFPRRALLGIMLYKHPERLVHGATFEQSIPPAALLCVRWCLQTPRGRGVRAVRFSPSPIDALSFLCGINGTSQTIPRI